MICPRCGQSWTAARAYCPNDGAELRSSISTSAFNAANSAQSGAILGDRYQIRGFLSKGATSRVYLAQDLLTKEPVAIKVLVESASAEIRERFLREGRATMSVRHPNVIRILGAGERQDGAPYLVMEVLLGETFGDYLRREGRMEIDLVLQFIRQAASGLAAAHRAGIVHRDVKPDNLFLLGEPGDPFAMKLIDFGLAKLKSSESRAGTVLGTIEYMPPEQILCDPTDARADVYSLGVVMFRALTGHLPFEARTETDLLAQHVLTPAPPPSFLLEGIDPWVERVIMTAMRKHPDNRYASMDALLEELEQLLGIVAGPPSGRPLAREPDLYHPVSEIGRMAAAALGAKLDSQSRR